MRKLGNISFDDHNNNSSVSYFSDSDNKEVSSIRWLLINITRAIAYFSRRPVKKQRDD